MFTASCGGYVAWDDVSVISPCGEWLDCAYEGFDLCSGDGIGVLRSEDYPSVGSGDVPDREENVVDVGGYD